MQPKQDKYFMFQCGISGLLDFVFDSEQKGRKGDRGSSQSRSKLPSVGKNEIFRQSQEVLSNQMSESSCLLLCWPTCVFSLLAKF